MGRVLEVWGDKDFTIEIPDDAKVTFGPWSPTTATSSSAFAGGGKLLTGTLRIYKGTKTTENVMAVFSGVAGFRDVSLPITPGISPMASPRVAPDPRIINFSSMMKAEKEMLAKMVADQVISKVVGEDEEEIVLVSKGPAPEEEDDDGIEALPF